jgi:YidC/Oxa1 family membrane protein insertase
MKDRFLNILIISFVVLILLQLFAPKQEKLVPPSDPYFSVSQKSVVVPNYPTLSLVNPTTQDVQIATCDNITVAKNLQKISLTEKFPKFCQNITISSGQTVGINIHELSELFTESTNIIFELNSQGKTSSQVITVEERGFFRTLLATLFYAPILNIFIGLLANIPGHSLGLAIIAITILVRLILLVPQHQMMVSARKMQEIQPKIKALQERYKWGDQAKLWMELMELYKSEKVNPLGSCLPLLIQTPILIVLYWVLISIQDHSNFYYFYAFFKSFDITVINPFFIGVNLLELGGIFGIILSLVVGIAQYIQIWLSQRGKPDTPKVEQDPNSFMPDPDLMNKFMLYGLPIMITISTFFFPHGVGLYWLIGTLFMIVQQQIANQIVARDKEKGVLIMSDVSHGALKKSTKKTKKVIEG